MPEQTSKLKDGSVVDDPRLDRLREFDPQSRNFRAANLLTDQQKRNPRSRHWRCTAVLDQGEEGACVGFAVAHELIATPAEVPNLTNRIARDIYWGAQRRDPWPGGSYPGVSSRERYEGTSVLAGCKEAKERGYIESYLWHFSLNEVLLSIGYHGPVILGINWYDSMYEPIAGRLRVAGELAGGHAILARGVNIRERTVTLHNSWGEDWGYNGDAVLSWDDLERLLHEQGEAVTFARRHSKPVLPRSTPVGLQF